MFISEIERTERANTFLEKAKLIHGTKFDYSKVEYINSTTKVIITCNEHGDFNQYPSKHLIHKYSCPECAKIGQGKSSRISKEQFIIEASKIHNSLYTYENSIIGKKHEHIEIYCTKHKDFFSQRLHSHLQGHLACKDCIREFKENQMHKIFKQKFIDFFINKFGNHYDFSEVEYINNRTPVIIKCLKHKHKFYQVHRNAVRYNTCSCRECK